MIDSLLKFVVDSVREQERVKNNQTQKDKDESNDLSVPRTPTQFWAVKKAGELVEPCKRKAKHHRERERHWADELAKAEVELREKGVTVDVFDPVSLTYINYNYQPAKGALEAGSVLTGSMASGSIGTMSSPGYGNAHQQSFQPRVDQKLLDQVKQCKAKMLEHRDRALLYEKQARAYGVNPDFTLRLTVEDVTYYGLGE